MTFQAGISGNPDGRPKGTGSRQQVFNALVEPHKEKLIETAISMAMNGNEAMLRLFLERMLPVKPREEPINIMLPDNISEPASLLSMSFAIFKALESNSINSEQFKLLLSAMKDHRENILAIDLERRLSELEVRGGEQPTRGSFLPLRQTEES